MQNLSIENIGKVIDLPGSSSISEKQVIKEMQNNGMNHQSQGGNTFSDVLRNSVDQVNQYQVDADHAVKEMISGRNKNIHETMLAVERADVSLKLMMQVRNKVLDAYREIIKMQV
jgi:flagellar hook-basal body complex protein FliE